jgi:hypothetical protein
MNLFRSEEHVRRWSLLAAGAEAGIADPRRLLAELFGLPLCTRRLDADYVDRRDEHWAGLRDGLKRLSDDPWWAPAGTGAA